MEECHLCHNKSTAVCLHCKKPICFDHLSKHSKNKITEAVINHLDQINHKIVCCNCEKNEQKKRIIILSIITSLLVAIALTLLILRLGNIWFW
ncbi:MAG: hypothetical protein JXA54_00865 [Candidatus Heimdallarchaeota archaeon]|nr:hypothetical protein [Candidatus Heimdallarchaeota archaeon]